MTHESWWFMMTHYFHLVNERSRISRTKWFVFFCIISGTFAVKGFVLTRGQIKIKQRYTTSRVESSLDKMLLIIQHNDSLSSKTKKYETLQTYANIQHFFWKEKQTTPSFNCLNGPSGGGGSGFWNLGLEGKGTMTGEN